MAWYRQGLLAKVHDAHMASSCHNDLTYRGRDKMADI